MFPKASCLEIRPAVGSANNDEGGTHRQCLRHLELLRAASPMTQEWEISGAAWRDIKARPPRLSDEMPAAELAATQPAAPRAVPVAPVSRQAVAAAFSGLRQPLPAAEPAAVVLMRRRPRSASEVVPSYPGGVSGGGHRR